MAVAPSEARLLELPRVGAGGLTGMPNGLYSASKKQVGRCVGRRMGAGSEAMQGAERLCRQSAHGVRSSIAGLV
jgi:hypothetical protein